MATDPVSLISRSRLLRQGMAGLLLFLGVYTALQFTFPALLGKYTLIDFDMFYIVGQMYWAGTLPTAYQLASMLEAQAFFTGTTSAMPWTYPPAFNLLVIPLPWLPIGVSLGLFTAASLAFYWLTLKKLSPENLPFALFCIFPSVLVVIKCGQNGFITGGLLAAFFLLFIRRSVWAGIPLGLMVIKPHLAIGAAVLLLASRRWREAALAVATAAGLNGIATLVFGMDIWPAFAGGVREASVLLAAGVYPLFRMASAYATLRSFEIPAETAFAVQALLATAACVAIALLAQRCRDARTLCGITSLLSTLISPYLYDYDLALLGVGLALLASPLRRSLPGHGLWGLVLAAWVATGYGAVSSLIIERRGTDDTLVSLASLVLVPMVVWTVWVVMRPAPRPAG